MKNTLKALALLMVLCMTCAFFTGCQTKQEELVIFTWAEYIPQDVIDEFTQETGIKVVYTNFESNDEMLTKLKAVEGETYDLVLASDYVIDIARKEGLLQKLNKDLIPRFGDIDPGHQGKFYDPANEYCVPYAAGTPLIVYDTDRVSIDIKGYNDLWNEALANSVVIIDDARLAMGLSLWSMDQSLNTTDMDLLRDAGDKLMGLRPNIRAFSYDSPHQIMINGEASVGFMFTPQVIQTVRELTNQGKNIKVVYPEEGMGYGIDSFFIPASAPNAEAANKFLNFILDGEISARISQFTEYMNCVSTAKQFLPQDTLTNEVLYIPADILGDAEFMMDIGPDATELVNEIYTDFKNS